MIFAKVTMVRARDRGWIALAVALAVLAGIADCWGTRYNLNPDGVSYIELAEHALGGGTLINAYWSPGYPMLLMPVLKVVPGRVAAIPAVHIVNFVLYLSGLALFVGLIATVEGEHGPGRWRRAAVAIVLFAAIVLRGVGLGLLTPDMAVVDVVVAMSLCCLRLERGTRPMLSAILLGLIAATGYWMKGILLPLAVILFALLLIAPPRGARGRAVVVVAALTFALCSLPLVVLVSHTAGRPSVGEVGRLNYAWAVDGVTPYAGWTGDSTLDGVPLHPPRVVAGVPRTLEFATPIRATYPLWFAPAYWYDGVRARFELAAQLRVLGGGLRDLGQFVLDQWVVALVLVGTWLFTTPRDARAGVMRTSHVLLAWSSCAALVYAAVHVEPRYLAGFAVITAAIVWSRVGGQRRRRGAEWFAAASVAAVLVVLALTIAESSGGFDPVFQPDYLLAGDSLRSAGIGAGEAVAVVGDAFEAYGIFVAGARITSQVMDSTGYWRLTRQERAHLNARLAASGVVAVLADHVAPALQSEGWRIFTLPDSASLGVLRIRAAVFAQPVGRK